MKTYEVVFSDGVRLDLFELEEYIGEEASKEIAARYIDDLFDECISLWIAPYRGTPRPDLRPNLRIIAFRHAVTIVFRIEEAKQLVVILGTAYRGRTIAHILKRNE